MGVSLHYCSQKTTQPCSQGVSSYRSLKRALAPGGGKMRDPGNEVDNNTSSTVLASASYPPLYRM